MKNIITVRVPKVFTSALMKSIVRPLSLLDQLDTFQTSDCCPIIALISAIA
ncbi:MAG: hypothetical protein Ct9H90mP19_2540 [Gammaproteobacteria bacterium]|nr:MAG: hypothetical protein Ct9H90mP19_2540 [Gammaproteobacteria bacterium]